MACLQRARFWREGPGERDFRVRACAGASAEWLAKTVLVAVWRALYFIVSVYIDLEMLCPHLSLTERHLALDWRRGWNDATGSSWSGR